MGDVNQVLFVEKHAEQFQGPYLEVGSKDYGNTADLRRVPEARRGLHPVLTVPDRASTWYWT